MNKRISIILSIILILGLMISITACGNKDEESSDDLLDLASQLNEEAEKLKEDVEEISEDAESASGVLEYSWPDEASVFGVPELEAGKIEGLGITNKSIAVGYAELKKEDIMNYIDLLVSEGFVEGIQYPGGTMWNYFKNNDDGAVDVTIAFGGTDGRASIVINPQTESMTASTEASSELKWLDAIPKEVPEFSKGTIKEAINSDMFITMEYDDVKSADVEAYKKQLIDAGFKLDEADSSENRTQFEKEDVAKMSIIIIELDFNDGYLILSIASN